MAGLIGAVMLTTPVAADISIPAGGSIALNGAAVDLGCTDVVVSGTFSLDTGSLINVRNVSILPGGVVNAGSSQITLAGDWSNTGSFNAGTSRVNFVDTPACATSSTISGNTQFYMLSLTSTIGKVYRFAVGSTQQILYQLTITGVPGTPIQLRSTVAGQTANINLSAFQIMHDIAVNDLVATGVWLAPYLVNQAPGGSALRWFGEPDYARIPTLGTTSLFALILLIFGFAYRARRVNAGRQFNGKDSKHVS